MAGNRMVWRDRSVQRVRLRRRQQERVITALALIRADGDIVTAGTEADRSPWMLSRSSNDAATTPKRDLEC